MTGATGPQGFQGISGLTGPQGRTGPQGYQGIIGISGGTGSQGRTGPQGLVGSPGATGNQGFQGLRGISGPQGLAGSAGTPGTTGNPGSNGVTGNQGFQGLRGISGPQGLAGSAGTPGATGNPGSNGTNGATGNQGFQGVRGVTGPQGSVGSAGSPGATGSNGNQGFQGLRGVTGSNGINGSTGNQGFQGLRGVTGPSGGPQGPAGPQSTLIINQLPSNTPLLSNSMVFETTSGTTSRATVQNVLNTMSGLSSSVPIYTDKFVFLNYQNVAKLVTWQDLKDSFEIPKNFTKLISHSYTTQLSTTGNITLDPVNIWLNHASSGNNGLRFELQVNMLNGKTASLPDELVLSFTRDMTTVTTKIISTASTFNVPNSRYNIDIYINQSTDLNLDVQTNITQYSPNSYVVNGSTVTGTVIHPVVSTQLNVTDYITDTGLISLSIPNGASNSSVISKWLLTGYGDSTSGYYPMPDY